MADIAALGFAVDTRKLKEANKELKKMPSAAQAAERSAKGLGKSASGAAQKVANDNAKATKSVRNLGGAFNIAKGQVIAFGVAAAAAFASAFAVKNLIDFSDALAEVSTLVEVTTFDMQGLEAAAIDMSKQFGTSGAAQVKAFYSTISAGASSAAEATETLSVANKLAVGGVTDIGTAVTGLTSFMNAYGDEVEGAIGVSDALFVGMRAGQTTIGELAGGLGKVASLAKASGTSFDELVASVSALTKGGVVTTEAITGVRAILAGVVKPTKEAADMAASLGLEFNAAALKAKGFQAFIADVAAKTGGSTDKLAQLFGGVEALVPILALSGKAGADFADIMEQMADKAGATEAAFDKIAMSAGFQAGRVWSALKAEVLLAGGALLNDMVPALKAVADNMGTLTKLIKIAGVTLLVAFGPAILAGIATGFGALAGAAISAIGAITAAMAANPIGAIAVGLTLAITALWEFRDEFKTVFGVDIEQAAKTAANFVLNSFSVVAEDLKFVWSNFGDIVGGAFVGGVNSAIRSINALVQMAISGINSLIQAVNKIPGVNISELTGPSPLAELVNKHSEDLSKAVDKRNALVTEIMQRDVFGDDAGAGVTGADLPGVSLPGIAGATGAANDNVGAAKDALDKIKDATRAAALEAKILNEELSEVDAKVLKAAEAAGLLNEKFGLMAGASADVDDLTKAYEKLETAQDAANKKAEESESKMKRIKDATDAVGGAFESALSSAIIEGGKLSDVFKNLANDILNMALQAALIKPLAGALGGGFGDLFGGLLSFNGGGSTGSGPRSGGVDGKGGFAAILHPKETVIDHTKGQSMGGGDVTVNVYAPPGSKVDQRETTGPGGRSIDIMIDEAVANNINRPGSRTGRALSNRGLSPQLASR